MADDMTRREFGDLCLEAHRRGMLADPYLRRYAVLDRPPTAWYETHPPEVPLHPPAPGEWIRTVYESSPWRAWHRFSGDMSWRPSWSEVKLRTRCGIDVGAAPHHSARSVDIPDGNLCRRCHATRRS